MTRPWVWGVLAGVALAPLTAFAQALPTADAAVAGENGPRPELTVTSIEQGSEVKGELLIDAVFKPAVDGAPLTKLDVLVDGTARVTMDLQASWRNASYNWDTRDVPDGRHNIEAALQDAAGRTRTYRTFVYVRNSAAAKPAPPADANRITIVSGAENDADTISSKFTIQVHVDEVAPAKMVIIYINGKLRAMMNRPPWSDTEDPRKLKLSDGPLVVQARIVRPDDSEAVMEKTVNVDLTGAGSTKLPTTTALPPTVPVRDNTSNVQPVVPAAPVQQPHEMGVELPPVGSGPKPTVIPTGSANPLVPGGQPIQPIYGASAVPSAPGMTDTAVAGTVHPPLPNASPNEVGARLLPGLDPAVGQPGAIGEPALPAGMTAWGNSDTHLGVPAPRSLGSLASIDETTLNPLAAEPFASAPAAMPTASSPALPGVPVPQPSVGTWRLPPVKPTPSAPATIGGPPPSVPSPGTPPSRRIAAPAVLGPQPDATPAVVPTTPAVVAVGETGSPVASRVADARFGGPSAGNPHLGLPGEAPRSAAPSRVPGRIVSVVASEAYGPAVATICTVVRGDTLYGLGRKYHVSVEDLARLNRLTPSRVLLAGRKLVIPTGTLTVNSKLVPTDVAPLQHRGGVATSPLRFIVEGLGGSVSWIGPAAQATATSPRGLISIHVGSREARIGDQRVLMDLAAYLEGDRTMVPARFISEALDVTIDMDPDSGNLVIHSNR